MHGWIRWVTVAHSEPYQTPKMDGFAKDVWQGSEYAAG